MNNINKLLLTTALVTCSFSAASAQVSNKNFVGPSVEVGIQFKNLDSSVDDEGTPAIFNNDSNTLGRLAFNYGLPTSDKLVVTLGASYTAGKSKASTSGYLGTTNAVYDNMYALYIAPTYVVNDTTAIFAKASYNSASARLSFTSDIVDSFVTDKNTIDGFGYGVGITTFVSKDVFLKAELEKINYGNNDIDGSTLKSRETNATIAVGIKF